MSQPALPSNLVSIEQLLAVLPVRRSRRWMVQYLHKTKVDLHGRPLYRRLGRDMLIYLDRVIEAAMPLRVVAARNKKTTSLYIRGSYLGISVDKSCRTDRRSLAVAILKRLEAAIERGES